MRTALKSAQIAESVSGESCYWLSVKCNRTPDVHVVSANNWNSVSAEIRNPIPKQTGNKTLSELADQQFPHCGSLAVWQVFTCAERDRISRIKRQALNILAECILLSFFLCLSDFSVLLGTSSDASSPCPGHVSWHTEYPHWTFRAFPQSLLAKFGQDRFHTDPLQLVIQ
jgi:hypothetical protein